MTEKKSDKIQIPKLIKLTMTLNVIHDHSLGWDFETGEWRGGKFASSYPYGFGVQRDASDTPGSNQGLAGADTNCIPGSPECRQRQVAAGGTSAATPSTGMVDTTESEVIESQ